MTYDPRVLEALIRAFEKHYPIFRSNVLQDVAKELGIDILMSDRSQSLQVKLRKVLGVISEMERISGVVKDEDLFDTLQEDHEMNRTEAERLIGILDREGMIYQPRPGCYKRTPG